MKYCTVLQPCGRDIMVAVPELLQPAATTPKSPTHTIPLTSSPQIPSSYPLTALQLSLLASGADSLPAGQAEGHVRGSEVMMLGSPGVSGEAAAPAAATAAAAASMSPEAAAASPALRRPLFDIAVDATAASVDMAVLFVRCCEDESSAHSMPGQLNADISAGVSAATEEVLEEGQCPPARDTCSHSAGNEGATKKKGRGGSAAQSIAEESVSAAAALRVEPADGEDLQVSSSLQR